MSAWAVLALSSCSDDSGDGGTQGMGGVGTGGTATGGTATGGTATGGTAGAMPTGGSPTGGSATGGNATGGSTGGNATGGSSFGGNATGGSTMGGNATGGNDTGGNATGGSATGGSDTGGASGMGGDGGGTWTCETDTDNGNHSHPLTVPGSDVEQGFQDAPYMLEDGGAGHTHTLSLSGYDFVYLQAGATRTVDSSMESGHMHPCTITCSLG